MPSAWQKFPGPRARREFSTFSPAACVPGPPLDNPACPDEDGRGDAVRPGDDVGAPVEAVGPVDVQVSCGSEHDLVTGCPASVGMGSRVGLAGVRLGLRDGDAHGALWGLAGEYTPEQLGSEFFGRVGEEIDVHADRLDMAYVK